MSQKSIHKPSHSCFIVILNNVFRKQINLTMTIMMITTKCFNVWKSLLSAAVRRSAELCWRRWSRKQRVAGKFLISDECQVHQTCQVCRVYSLNTRKVKRNRFHGLQVVYRRITGKTNSAHCRLTKVTTHPAE